MPQRFPVLTMAMLSLCSLLSAQTVAPSPGTGGSLPSVRTKPETIDEITPDALAHLAAQRRQREQTIVASASSAQPLSGPAQPAPESQVPLSPDLVPRTIAAQNELLA